MNRPLGILLLVATLGACAGPQLPDPTAPLAPPPPSEGLAGLVRPAAMDGGLSFVCDLTPNNDGQTYALVVTHRGDGFRARCQKPIDFCHGSAGFVLLANPPFLYKGTRPTEGGRPVDAAVWVFDVKRANVMVTCLSPDDAPTTDV